MKKIFTILFCIGIICTKAQIPVKSVSTKTQDTTKNSKFSKKGYDSWKAHTDMGATSTVVNPLYEAPTTAGNNPLMTQNRPGTPIGGIIVKGGKNPGGQMMTLTTNENGEITLNITEAGNYKFTIVASAASAEQAASKDNRTYTSGRKNEEVAATAERKGWDGTVKGGSKIAKPGQPIGGIIVKGGRNPGGQMFTLVTNINGEIELNKLEPGVYKFIVTSPIN